MGLGIFAGFKYLLWDGSGTIIITTSTNVYSSHADIDNNGQALGPALGISWAMPLMDSLFLSASISGLVTRARMEDRVVTVTSQPSSSNVLNEDNYWYSGFNAAAGLGYYFSSLRSTLIIGGRYQYLKGRINRETFSME